MPRPPAFDELPGPGADDADLRRFLHGLPEVDGAAVRRRVDALDAAPLTGRAWGRAFDAIVRLMDLTTLEATDTPARIRSLGARAVRPDPADPSCPSVAALCVYSDLVPDAVRAVAGSSVKVAAVTGAFPSGRAPLAVKLAGAHAAVRAGADELDVVLDRAAFLDGRYREVRDEIAAFKQACGDAVRLKVILETGELVGLDSVRRAAWLALLAGADYVKTSTGKTLPVATRPATLVMLEAARDFADRTGRTVGVKAAGGIRTAAEAAGYLELARDVAGDRWLEPDRFRIGASSLLDDVVARRATGSAGPREPATPDA